MESDFVHSGHKSLSFYYQIKECGVLNFHLVEAHMPTDAKNVISMNVSVYLTKCRQWASVNEWSL